MGRRIHGGSDLGSGTQAARPDAGALGFIVGSAFGFGLVVALRAISGLEIFQTADRLPHLIVPAITGPLGFLVGLGAFDYWFRWAAGKAIPEDHSQHGARSWRDYFKFNTDHKVSGSSTSSRPSSSSSSVV